MNYTANMLCNPSKAETRSLAAGTDKEMIKKTICSSNLFKRTSVVACPLQARHRSNNRLSLPHQPPYPMRLRTASESHHHEHLRPSPASRQ